MSVAETRNLAGPVQSPDGCAPRSFDPAQLQQPAGTQQEAPGLGAMVGRSIAMQHLFARMRATAPHFRMATMEGEPGVGKQLAAQMLHRIGPAAHGPFAPWTAAEFLEKAPEIWRSLARGLLYLSRVDELSAQEQMRLRDFIERAAQQRLRLSGACGPLQVIAGASQPLRRLAAAGAFRSDLAGSLSAIRFAIPPLRERREDIPLLAEVFLLRWSAEHGKPLRGFAPATMVRLSSHLWPGNAEELETVVGAAALETTSQWIRSIDLPKLKWPARGRSALDPGEEDPRLDRAILRHVTRVLARVEGNKLRAARLLGISRSTLYRMLSGGLPPDEQAEAAAPPSPGNPG